ncbi:hypothetical protein [Aureimonas sp. SA4125]|uniref:hypothetical protein n=1 Tax=Aureimonas sp. SA4125 TaxID=2826993 RepID=UPI001CC4F605|nr:hypothetical protein [Aureimonas sp. SA4125]
MTVHLDTLAIAGKLKAAGFSEAQAEAMSFILRDAREVELSQLATKADLAVLATASDLAALAAANERTFLSVANDLAAMAAANERTTLSTANDLAALAAANERTALSAAKDLAALAAEFRALELRLDVKIEAGKAETIKWVVSAIGFQTLVMVAAIVALSRSFQP